MAALATPEEALAQKLDNHEDLSAFRIRGLPPLLYAVSLYDEELALDIIERGIGVDFNVRHDYGYRPLHYAVEGGMVNTVAALVAALKRRADTPTAFQKCLEEATIDMQLQMKNVQSGGKRPLHLASVAAEPAGTAMVQLLLDAGATTDAPDWDGNVPATLAAIHGRHQSAALLLKVGDASGHATGLVPPSVAELQETQRRADRRVKALWEIPPSLRTPYAIAKFLSDAECEYLLAGIRAYTAEHGWTSDRHRGYATTDVRAKFLPIINAWILTTLETRLFPALMTRHGFERSTFAFRDLFFVQYHAVEGGQRSVGVHRDGSVVSFNILLNATSEFTAGGTFFEGQGSVAADHGAATVAEVNDEGVVFTINRGDMLVHSGKARHGGHPITDGERVILVGFIDAGDVGSNAELHFQDHSS
jgi:hypothetical protein|eukprot:Stramenopile-MAST_4_protein_2355